MKKILIVALLSSMICGLNAQIFTLSGTVTSSTDGYEVSFVSVKDTVTNKGTFSNAEGYYSMTLEEGTYILEYRTLGYLPQIKVVNMSADKVLNIELVEEVVELEAIVLENTDVEEHLNTVEMSTQELSVEEIKKIPSFLGEPDVINAIKLLPGVTAVGEGSSGFNVRGGNIDQNLILSDNASIYSSSHLFGFFSVFNPDAVKDLKLYKGGMPAKFGERASSVLDVHQRSGDFEKFTVDGGLGLVSSRLTIGGPIKKDTASFLISARRTYVDLFFNFSQDEAIRNTDAYFYDINAKLDYLINSKNQVSFTGYYGKDVFKFNDGALGFNWGNRFGVINWDHTFSDDFIMHASLSSTDYRYTFGFQDFFEWTSIIGTTTEKFDFEYSKIEKHKINFGLTNNNHHFRPAEFEPIGVFEGVFQANKLKDEWSMESGVYLEDDFELSDKITLRGGLRYSLYNSFGEAQEFIYEEGKSKEVATIIDTINFKTNEITKTYSGLEPRFSALYKLDSTSSLKFAYNRNLQFIQLVSNTTNGLPLDVWKAADYHIEPLKVNQIALGYVRGLANNKLELTLEGYYKRLRDVIDYKNNADLFFNESLETELLSGIGRAYGLEFMLRKKKGKFTGWLSYTLSRTEVKVDSELEEERINNGDWYKASFHKPHDVTLVGTYQINKRISTSFNFVYATGRAITLPDGKYEVLGVIVPNYSSRNQSRLSDYHRLDLSLEIQSKKNENRRYKSSCVVSIYNVYARKNAYSYTFTDAENFSSEVERLSILGTFLPSITYNFKF